MINNFELIKNNMHFLNEKSFYFILIIKRKKENPDMKEYSLPVDAFYIFNTDQFERVMPHIIEKCEQNRARAYVKMNCLDAESVMLEMISLATQEIRKENWKHMSRLLNSACGMVGKQNGNEKMYLIDLDDEYADKKDTIINYLENYVLPIKKDENNNIINKVQLEVPTRHGVHLLSTGFDKREFTRVFPGIDIHDDGITLLYFPTCAE